MTDFAHTNSPIGILHIQNGQPVEVVLENVAHSLQSRGLAVAGYLQREVDVPGNCCSDLYLESLSTTKRHRISQSLGTGSKGCRLDPQGLAEAAGVLQADIKSGADVLILNRFGKGEADGHGFRSVIEVAVGLGIPVLMAVREPYFRACQTFVGEFLVSLAINEEEILNWCTRQLSEQIKVHAA